METKLVHIKYFKWNGDPVAASSEMTDEPNIDVDFNGKDLILRDHQNANKHISVQRGLNVVAILDPRTIGYDYFRMSDGQLNDYINAANHESNLVLS